MKVCVVNDRFTLKGPGGGQYRILGIARQLQKLDFDVTLCCPYFHSRSLYDFPEVPPQKSWFRNQYANTIELLQKISEKNGYDALLVELPCPITKGATVFYGKGANKHVFVDFGDLWYSDETGLIHRKINAFLVKKICEKADRISAATRSLQNLLTEITGREVLYSPCGVDIEMFNPKNTAKINIPEAEGKFVILYQGAINSFTGCQFLPQIAKGVIMDGGKKDVVFLVVGDGPLLENLKTKVRQNNFSEHFIFTGKVNHSVIPRYIAAANVV
ncbi:MAG TPA: glycosyltransferase [archaeon]|nr:glycosyltransferase [archaeon]